MTVAIYALAASQVKKSKTDKVASPLTVFVPDPFRLVGDVYGKNLLGPFVAEIIGGLVMLLLLSVLE